MGLQSRFLFECGFTDVTLVWLRVGVSQSVQAKCTAERKGFPTDLTHVGPLSRVSDHVQTEIPLSFQHFSADFANNSFVRVNHFCVVTEGLFAGATSVAQSTFEWHFRQMQTYVIFQRYHLFESIATCFTFEWSFTGMNKAVAVEE